MSDFNNIALIGDCYGIDGLLSYIKNKKLKCIIGASIRPQYFAQLQRTSSSLDVPFIVQPKYNTIEYKEFIEKLKQLKIDILICRSYSMLIRKDLLELVNYNAINVHTALLPKNRGPNPIQWALIKGEEYTGTTIHYMDEGVDTGDIIAQEKLKISTNDTWVTLAQKAVDLSNKLLENNINSILNGINTRIEQKDKDATINFRLDVNYPKINFQEMSDLEIYNLIRAQVAPLKGAYIEKNKIRTYYDNMMNIEDIKQLRQKYEK